MAEEAGASLGAAPVLAPMYSPAKGGESDIRSCLVSLVGCTGISSQIKTKLRDWAVWKARASCFSQAALSSNDSKTLYLIHSGSISIR